jgi:DNA-binding NarL/FixJ family response regulator
VEESLKYGADGFLIKEIGPDELIESIKTVMNGVQVIHPDAMHVLVKQINKKIK